MQRSIDSLTRFSLLSIRRLHIDCEIGLRIVGIRKNDENEASVGIVTWV